MSRVYFRSPSGEAELQGAERAHFGGLASSIGLMALGVSETYDFDNGKFVAALDPPRKTDARFLATTLRAHESEVALRFNGGSHNVWNLFLNAALAIGGEPLRFGVRLHAQCEIHGWIDASDREWAATVIEAGRATGLYRAGVGWDRIVAFLRSRGDEPVVLSYSVCEGFPNRDLTDVSEDEWEAMSREERWAKAWAALREMSDRRICPDGVLFGDGTNAFQARDAITGWSERWAPGSR